MKIISFSIISGILCASYSAAEIKTPSFFADGMVLQQETGASIWGWDKAGTETEVSFAGQSLKAKADSDGMWKVTFKGLKASKEGSELTIKSGESSKVIKDVLVGEVWIASGQSNMEWTMSRTTSAEYAKTVNHPLIRQYSSRNVSIDTPQTDYVGEWKKADSSNTPNLSAVAYHFAEKLHKSLDVPVGILELSWGGKPVQSFISHEAISKLPEGQHLVEAKAKAIESYDEKKALAKYEKQLAAFKENKKKWEAGGKKGKSPRPPRKPSNPAVNSSLHSTIYNGMIHPMVGYGVRGAIWYQGESNRRGETAKDYGELLACMVNDWRTRWDNEFSFYWVQLADFMPATTEPGIESGWVDVQDEMRRALKTIPKSGMAVINDIGDAKDIHPRNKKDVGERLALWALTYDYGKKGIVYSGPLYKSTNFDGGKAIVSFDYAKGLKSRDGKKLARFELAGADGKWVWGDAVIKGETVEVSAPSVKKASKVRYAWASNPEGSNLVNGAGLPTSCFSSETK